MSWSEKTVGDFVEAGVADIQTGPFGTQLKASEYTADGTPVINVRNVGFGELRPEKLEYLPESKVNALRVHVLEDRDIVFGRKGAVERHLFVQKEQVGWVQGSDCIRLRFTGDQVVPQFISYAFRLRPHQDWMLAQCGNKATMPSLNQDVIKRIPLRVPDEITQKTIVSKLSAYDDLIENNQRRIALLEEAARLLYREWFVHFRFPGHEHVKIIDGVPEGWEVLTFEDALVLQRGFDLPVASRNSGEVPVYGSTGIVGFHDTAKVGAPMLTTGRSGSLGQVSFVSVPSWPLNTSLWVKEFRKVSPWYGYFLLSELGLEKYNGGASVPTLDRKVVHRLPLILPPEQYRSEFDNIVKKQFEMMGKLTTQNIELEKARDLLLPRLMDGRLEV